MSSVQSSPKKRARRGSSPSILTEFSDEALSPIDPPPGHLAITPPCGDPLCRSTICVEAPRVTVHVFMIGSLWEKALGQKVEDEVWTAPCTRGYANLRHCYQLRHLEGANEEDCQYDIFFPGENKWNTYIPELDIAIRLPGFIILRHHMIPEDQCKDIEALKNLARRLYNAGSVTKNESKF